MKAYRIAKMFLAFAACGSLSGFASSAASDADIPLRPNERAPAGASGVARFETENGAATLAVTLQGLSPGSYRLSAVRKSDQAAVALGTIEVTDPTATPDTDTSQNRKERNNTHQATRLQVQAKVSLPPELPPANIAEIRVTSPDGAVLLSGKPPQVIHPAQGKSGN
jgi:hypothetical protein